VRHALRIISRDSPRILLALLTPHVDSLKRLLFPKLLRTLPLPHQVAVVDALAFILEAATGLIPIDDRNLLAFISELLKMMSIADGEFDDPSFGSVALVNKDGWATNNDGTSEPSGCKHSNFRPSSVLLRRASTIEDNTFKGKVVVPAELTMGVQLRVSALLLFRGFIRGSPDQFYDADNGSTVRLYQALSFDRLIMMNHHSPELFGDSLLGRLVFLHSSHCLSH